MGDRQPVEVLQWLAYIGRTRNNVTYAGKGSEIHLPGVPNVKVDGYCEETNEVFENMGRFWHGCSCMSNRYKPIGNTEETLLSQYVETQARLKKIENAGYKIVSIWWCEFRKLLRENSDLEIELSSHPFIKCSPINIQDAFTEEEPSPQRHITEFSRGGNPLCGCYQSVPLHLQVRQVSCGSDDSVRGCRLSP